MFSKKGKPKMTNEKVQSIYGHYLAGRGATDKFKDEPLAVLYNRATKQIDVCRVEPRQKPGQRATLHHLKSYKYSELAALKNDFGHRTKDVKEPNIKLGNNIDLLKQHLSHRETVQKNRKASSKFRKSEFSKEDIARANAGDVLAFAQEQGIQLRQVGHDSFKGVDHDSLVITPSKNSFYWNSRSVGGHGALDFAKNYILADSDLKEKEKFKKATEMVLGSNVQPSTVKEYKREPFAWDQKQVSQDFSQARNYLVNQRRLAPKFIDFLHKQGLIEQNHYGDALFVWRDPATKQIKGASQQGTVVDHKKFGKRGTLKRIERNSTYAYGFSFDSQDVVTGKGQPENLRFFEAPIDAMSYYQLNPRKLTNTRFVAMDGLKKETVANYINLTNQQLAKQGRQLKSVGLAVDNDEAGNNFVKKMQQFQARTGKEGKVHLNFESYQPSSKFGKDWNDVLKAVSKNRQKTMVRQQNQVKETPNTNFRRLQGLYAEQGLAR